MALTGNGTGNNNGDVGRNISSGGLGGGGGGGGNGSCSSSSASSRDDRSPKQQQQQHKQQQQQSSSICERISPKTNCFNLTSAAAAVTDDNTISGNHQHHHHHLHHQQQQQQQQHHQRHQQINENSAPATPLAVNLKLNAAISTATSPLIENGNGSTYLHEKFLPSSTTSPSDLRKEYDVTKVNGKCTQTKYIILVLFTNSGC